MAQMRLRHEIVGVQQRLALLDHHDRSRHNLLHGRLVCIRSGRDNPTDHIRVRQDTDDFFAVRHEQAPDSAIAHDPRGGLGIGVTLDGNEFLSWDHE